MIISTEQQRIGELIRTKRKENDITQEELGQKLGIGKVAVLSYEKGKVKVIPYEKRVKLSKILNISMDELLYAFENPFNDVYPYTEEDTALNESDYEILREILKDYNIMLIKSTNDSYILVCNSTGETFSIPSSELNLIHSLLIDAKLEVGLFVFLRIKSGVQTLREFKNIQPAKEPFLTDVTKTPTLPLNDDDQNTKK